MLANGIKETTATTGTGTVTLAQVTGYARFSSAFPTGSLVQYAIKDGNNWEWGTGTTGASNTLARTYVSATLVSGTYTINGESVITLSGNAEVYCSSQGGNWQGVNGSQPVNNAYFAKFGGGQYRVGTGYYTGAGRTSPILCPRPFLLKKLAIAVSTLAATSTVKGAVYADNGSNYPGKRLYITGAYDVSTTGVKEETLATPLFMPPGLYWTAIGDGTGTAAGLIGLNGGNMAIDGGVARSFTGSFVSTDASSYPALFGVSSLSDPHPAGSSLDTASAHQLWMQGVFL